MIIHKSTQINTSQDKLETLLTMIIKRQQKTIINYKQNIV